jgi:hypothetical protein
MRELGRVSAAAVVDLPHWRRYFGINCGVGSGELDGAEGLG